MTREIEQRALQEIAAAQDVGELHSAGWAWACAIVAAEDMTNRERRAMCARVEDAFVERFDALTTPTTSHPGNNTMTTEAEDQHDLSTILARLAKQVASELWAMPEHKRSAAIAELVSQADVVFATWLAGGFQHFRRVKRARVTNAGTTADTTVDTTAIAVRNSEDAKKLERFCRTGRSGKGFDVRILPPPVTH
jgi:hypothetical protein